MSDSMEDATMTHSASSHQLQQQAANAGHGTTGNNNATHTGAPVASSSVPPTTSAVNLSPAQPNLVPSTSPAPVHAASSIPPTLNDNSLATRVFNYRNSCLTILSQYQTHHLIPHSGKVVIFDSQLVVKHAFDGMVHHDLSCIAEGTPIATDEEVSVPIEQLSASSNRPAVLSLHPHEEGLKGSTVEAHMDRGRKECVELMFDDGRTLVCTRDHRLRMSNGKWVDADALEVGVSHLCAAPVDYATVSNDEDLLNCNSFSLVLRSLNSLMDMHFNRVRTLSFTRMAGYLTTTANSCTGWIQLENFMDARRVTRDITRICGNTPQAKEGAIELPTSLLASMTEIGLFSSCPLLSIPSFLLDPSCPTPLIREFVAALFGRNGYTTDSTVGLRLTCSAAIVPEQSSLLRTQLVPLLTRLGLDESRIQISLQSGAIDVDDANTTPVIHLLLDPSLIPTFSSQIGFRYNTADSVKLTTINSSIRIAHILKRQSLAVVTHTKQALGNGSISLTQALANAKKTLSNSCLLHPSIAAWNPLSLQQLEDGFQVDEVLSPEFDASLSRQCNMKSQLDSLPFTQRRLIAKRDAGVRPTYDLSVPNPERAGDECFIANSICAHNCAPVWDSYKKKYVGLLSVSDFLDILMSSYAADDKNMFDNLSNARICDWAEYKKQRGTSINRLLCISPEATLHEAVRQLLNYRVHRLCVVQLALADTVLRIITNHGILRFLRNNCPLELSSSISVRDLGIGVFQNLLTLSFQTPVIKALELLSAYKVSSIPIVDENNRPLDVYTRADVRYLALDQTWRNLDMTIEEALSKHKRGRALPLCSRDDSIHTISGILVSSMRHSLICVDSEGVIEGVVSLTDIFSFLLNSAAPAAESRIAALKKDYAQFEAAEADQTTLVAEELLKQRNYLAEHGQLGPEGEGDIVLAELDQSEQGDHAMEDANDANESVSVSKTDGGARGSAPAISPAAMAKINRARTDASQPLSPGIQPSPVDNTVPKDMDYLG